jgi:uncharacterized protein
LDPASDAAGKGAAMGAHLGCLVGYFIVPLVLFLMYKDKNAFVRHHAREALNFQLTLLVTIIVGFGILILGTIVSSGPLFLLILPVFWAIGIGSLVFTIIGAVQANNLRYWKYPVRIPFIR